MFFRVMERKQIDSEMLSDIFINILSQVLVCYDLDDLYIKNKREALILVQQHLDEDDILSDDRLLVKSDFINTREKILKKIESVDENDTDEMIMLLIYIVISFEQIVNQHVYFELMYRGFTRKEIKKILHKLSTEEKLGWFLKLICREDYTNSENWSLISNFIQTRNFYIHYGPDTSEINSNHRIKLSKDSFMSFVEYSSDCYSFLNECKTEKFEDFSERVSNIKNFLNNESKE